MPTFPAATVLCMPVSPHQTPLIPKSLTKHLRLIIVSRAHARDSRSSPFSISFHSNRLFRKPHSIPSSTLSVCIKFKLEIERVNSLNRPQFCERRLYGENVKIT